MKKITVLVTDGDNRSSLAVTRSLGKYGCRVLVTASQSQSLSANSRYCEKGFQVYAVEHNEKRFATDIVSIVNNEDVDVIFPMTEPTILALLHNRDLLNEHVIVASAELKAINSIFDKYNLFKMADKLGVDIPKTYFIQDKATYESTKFQIDSFPVVIKPCQSKIQVNDGYISTRVMYASNMDELDDLYSNIDFLEYPSLIQERIYGDGTGLFTIFDGESHKALFSHKRLREKPPSGGVSVVSESVTPDTDMVAAVSTLLSNVNWQGIAMGEFKRDVRDGKPKLIEINGRFWGSLQLAIAAGVDFPVLLLRHVMGDPIDATHDTYKKGIKLKWFLGTLDHLVIRLFSSKVKLNLPDESPSKLHSILEFLNIFEKDTSFDVISKTDIKPFIYEIKQYIRALLK
ncbi:MAG: ATP-grasp domain-containing protein [Candidatus Thiodiazotropha sp.]